MDTNAEQPPGTADPQPDSFAQRPPAVTTAHTRANLLTPSGDAAPAAQGAAQTSSAPAGAYPVPSAWWLAVILLAGFICRAALSLRAGHGDDLVLFEDWLRGLSRHGLGEFFNHSNANYPPLHLLTLRAQAWLLELAGVDLASPASSPVIRFWLRAPACLADALIALLLYREAGRRGGRRWALSAASIYFLNPAVLYVSAYWGQVDSIHTLFILLALLALNRRMSWCAGVAVGLALLQKFQSIALLPLILFDVYRYRRWAGAAGWLIGAGLSASLVLAPFVVAGSWRTAMDRGYVRVLAQYPRLSINAYNLWHVGDHHLIGDFHPPHLLIRAAGGGQSSVADDASWYLRLTWRRIGSALFVLFTAGVLALYARKHSAADRALAAGALAMVFFLFPTEMHERYAFPVLGLLVPWVVGNAWRERLYWALSVLLLLNVAAVLPIEQISSDLSVAMVFLFVVMLLLLGVRMTGRPSPPAGLRTAAGAAVLMPAERFARTDETPKEPALHGDEQPPPPSALVKWFCTGTFVAWVVALNTACVLIYMGATSPWPHDAGATYLTELEPVTVQQQHAPPQGDAEVEGGPLHVGDRYYLRGIGAHARSKLVYPVPQGAARFKAVAGVSRGFQGQARLTVMLDGKPVAESGSMREDSPPFNIDVEVKDASTITLVADPDGPNNGDHVDWADARFTK